LGREDADARAVSGGRLESSRYPTQQRLVAAIRRGEEPAIHELFVLYAPLLRDQAKKMSVPVGERDQIVETLLDDIVIHLVEVENPPRELTSYIVTSLRNRVRTGHRDSTRAQRNDESAYAEYGDSTERIVAECHSEYGMRASLPMDDSRRAPLRSAVKKLADKSAKELSADELALMIGVGRHIPLRDLADQLGLSHGALRVRLSRLRDRFIKLATQYVTTVDPAEKNEIVRFLRRAGVHLSEPFHEKKAERTDSNPKRLPQEEQS
jgi:DNA-directed RNA polymerase specialized sigma24 family protein